MPREKEECNVECFIVDFPLLRLSEIRVNSEGEAGERAESREDCVARGGWKERASERGTGREKKKRSVMSSA